MVKIKSYAVIMFICLSFCIVQTTQANLWFKKVGSLLLGEGIDIIWDKMTGKPDVRALNKRLVAIEEALEKLDDGLAKIIYDLRSRITQDTTKEEYYAMATEAFTNLNERMTELERRVSRNEQDIRELDDRLSRVEKQIDIGKVQPGLSSPRIPQFQPPPPPPTETRRIRLRGINFDYDSAKISSVSSLVLDEAAQVLKDNLNVRVEILGHSDSAGTDEYNQRLSERRVQAVKQYLVSRGIAASRLLTLGAGEREPIADNMKGGGDSPEGRAMNRRVELKVIE